MGSSMIDNNGFRRQKANPISRVGVFPYKGSEIDYDKEFGLKPDEFYWVFRSPEELFCQRAIDSFNGLPIRCGHVMLGDKPDTVQVDDAKNDPYKKVGKEADIDGCIYNVRPSLDNPEFLIAEFCIYTDRMKEILEGGKIKQLSLGYTCRYEPEEGIYNGMPYQFKQVNLKGNHLALVKRGRCGSSVCVYDEMPDGAPVVVTFDSLPEGINLMEDNKQECNKLDRAKALAAKIKGGDEQLAMDCLDFADFSAEDRKKLLDSLKEKKECKDKTCEDKAPKATKDDAPAEPPTPPEVPQKGEEKPAESPAPAASAASAPAPEPAPEGADNPPAEVPSTKDGEKPAEDAAPCKGCDEAPTKDCGDAPTKDSAPQGVTTPSIPTPVAAVEAPAEKKDDDKKEEVPAEDKAPEAKPAEEKPAEEKPAEKAAEAEKPEEKPEEKPAEEKKETPAEDSLGPGKPAALGPEPTPALGKEKTDEPKDPEKVVEPKKEKISQDEYTAFAVEYHNAQVLADTLRPHIKVAFDSTTMREIDVARFAAKNIPSLAFVMDEANDDIVLAAVRGHVAAYGRKEVPTADAAPETPAVPEPPKEEKPEVPAMDSVFEDVIPATPSDAPAYASNPASEKELTAYLCGK